MSDIIANSSRPVFNKKIFSNLNDSRDSLESDLSIFDEEIDSSFSKNNINNSADPLSSTTSTATAPPSSSTTYKQRKPSTIKVTVRDDELDINDNDFTFPHIRPPSSASDSINNTHTAITTPMSEHSFSFGNPSHTYNMKYQRGSLNSGTSSPSSSVSQFNNLPPPPLRSNTFNSVQQYQHQGQLTNQQQLHLHHPSKLSPIITSEGSLSAQPSPMFKSFKFDSTKNDFELNNSSNANSDTVKRQSSLHKYSSSIALNSRESSSLSNKFVKTHQKRFSLSGINSSSSSSSNHNISTNNVSISGSPTNTHFHTNPIAGAYVKDTFSFENPIKAYSSKNSNKSKTDVIDNNDIPIKSSLREETQQFAPPQKTLNRKKSKFSLKNFSSLNLTSITSSTSISRSSTMTNLADTKHSLEQKATSNPSSERHHHYHGHRFRKFSIGGLRKSSNLSKSGFPEDDTGIVTNSGLNKYKDYRIWQNP